MMIHYRQRKLRAICAGLVFTMAPGLASALQISDIPQFGVKVFRDSKEYVQNLDKEQLKTMAMNLASEVGKALMDAGNNAWANAIARRGAAEQAKNELEIARKLEPSINLCSSVTYSLSLNEAGCEDQTEMRDQALEYLAESSMFSGDKSAGPAEAQRLADDVLMRSPELFIKDTSMIDEEEEKTSAFDSYLLLSSSKPTLNLNEDQQEAMKTMIKIVTPSYKYQGKSIDNFGTLDQAKIMQREMPTLIARQLLLKLLQIRSEKEDGTPSNLAVYQEFMDSYEDPSAVEAIANGNATTPDSLKRTQLIIALYQAKIQLDQFKSQLRREYAQAHQLLLISK